MKPATMLPLSFSRRSMELAARLGLPALALLGALLWFSPVRAAAPGAAGALPPDYRAGLIAAGEFHTCAIDRSGALLCWGDNGNGRLGDGTEEDRTTPAPVVGLESGVMAVVAGEEHTCALTTAGAVKCWGQRTKNGADGDSSVPIAVAGLESGVTAISASRDHTCALVEGGDIHCWGFNRSGALGDGTTTNSATPVLVVGLTGSARAVSAGGDFACAVLVNGEVQCWGNGTSGQLGNGETESSGTPVTVEGLDASIVEVVASSSFACAHTDTGAVNCWGNNSSGQLGDNTTTDSSTPVAVQDLAGPVIGLSSSSSHICAVLESGQLQCWGANRFGQLGLGCATAPHLLPQSLSPFPSKIIGLQTGWNHTCAMNAQGQLFCWGWNERGQVGLPAGDAPEPVEVVGIDEEVTALALGVSHSCALTAGGDVKCWGSNVQGQLGDGSNASCQQVVDVALGGKAKALAAGSNHTCAVLTSGQVRCWGNNREHQINADSELNYLSPVAPSVPVSNVMALGGGEDHTCALLADRGVTCWGSNLYEQVAAATTISDAVTLDSGRYQNCTVDSAGALTCWGSRGLVISPQQPYSVTTAGDVASSVASGENHGCAIIDGAVRCWGVGLDGQLGAGAGITNTVDPVPAATLVSGVEAIDAGFNHTCAIRQGGAFCWGENEAGQLGNGAFETSFTPVAVVGLSSGVASIATGPTHTCAILADGKVKCWGSRAFGIVGDGESTLVPVPVCVDALCPPAVYLPALQR